MASRLFVGQTNYSFLMDGNPYFDKKRLIEDRRILIFLSSTFSDMQEERNKLTDTFVKLKIKAAQRNVALSLLDLRWGVTDEEARSGKVLSVCLNEIEHSHPFFIGLLGNRYGHASKPSVFTKNPELLERYPWLKADIAAERSITEIEMLYGALRHLDHPVEAAFYIKQTSNPDDNPKQTALKKTVHSQKQYPVEDYTDVAGLCALVEQHVCSMLDRYFPDGECTPLERERTAQRAYINSRHSHFVGREKELEHLDTFARSTSTHLVITGDSGMGKSALLANWIRHNENRNDFNLVYHFVGNSFAGNNYESVLRHLCDEIYDIYHIEKDLNRQEKPEEEAQRLVSELISYKKPLVVVIDGINQIMAQKDEKLLLWLPAANGKVKFIFTTLRDDPTMQAFERLGYEVRTLEALTDDQRKQFAIEYLEQVGKHLNEDQLQRTIDDQENRNTLVLRTLLDELICFGLYEQLKNRIDYYLSANSIPDFFDRVLKRMEDDYDNGQDLVSHSLRLIALSEHGMNEEELLAITGFRQMDWHLFYCAFFNHVVVKGGLLTFSHQYVVDAVAKRYAIGDSKTNAPYRQEIVKYFSANSTDDEIQRQRCISELAHQYYHLEDWPNLHKVLLSFEAFDYFDSTDEVLLAKYWRVLIADDSKQYGLLDYLQLPQPKEKTSSDESYNNIGIFVSDYFAEYDKALEYYFKALTIRKNSLGSVHPNIATFYDNIGSVYYLQGGYNKALEFYQKALTIREKALGKNHPNAATSYNNIGSVYYNEGSYNEALEYYQKALETDEKVRGVDHSGTATDYNNIAGVYYALGDYDKALECFQKALDIFEKILGTEHPDTATSYNNIAVVYDAQGYYGKALEFYQKALTIRVKALGTEHPSTAISYNNIGVVYKAQGKYGKALEHHHKALTIREKFLGTEHSDTATSYNNIGLVYDKLGDSGKALEYHQKALAIREKVFGTLHPDTAQSYNNIGVAYKAQGNYNKALEYHQKALEVYKKVLGEEHPHTATSYNNIGGVYNAQGDYGKALEYYHKALETDEKVLGTTHHRIAIGYNNIGTVYYVQSDYDKALEYHQKALEIDEKVQGTDHLGAAIDYNNIGMVYKAQGDYGKALEYYQKALETMEKVLGTEHPDTATSYNNIAVVYDAQGDYGKALEYYQKALEIREKVLGEEHPDTATSYNNIGAVYKAQGNYGKALEYHQKALGVYKKVLGEEHPHTATSYNNIGSVYDNLDNNSKAMEYHQKALAIREKVLGSEHPDTAQSYNNIGAVYKAQGNYDKALEYFQKVLIVFEKVLGPKHLDTATSYNNIAVVYDAQGDYGKALEYYHKALGTMEKVLGTEHPDTAISYNNIGVVYWNRGDYGKAFEYYQKALKIWEKTLGTEHPNTKTALENINLIKQALDSNNQPQKGFFCRLFGR